MIEKAKRTTENAIDSDGFVARAYFPGHLKRDHSDHGLGPLATIMESFLAPGTHIKLHEHVQDEIVSWVPAGVMRHDDPQGEHLTVDADHLMIMNAGRGFRHEERTAGRTQAGTVAQPGTGAKRSLMAGPQARPQTSLRLVGVSISPSMRSVVLAERLARKRTLPRAAARAGTPSGATWASSNASSSWQAIASSKKPIMPAAADSRDLPFHADGRFRRISGHPSGSVRRAAYGAQPNKRCASS